MEAVPSGIRESDGQLFVTLFRGVPFAAGTSIVEQMDPDTGHCAGSVRSKVRIPKEFHLDGEEVEIRRRGKALALESRKRSRTPLFVASLVRLCSFAISETV